MMSDTKALQAGTSHFLGQNFARAFDIRFQNKAGELEECWTTSWGVSTRLIGAIIMTHSDDDGLVLPPRVAPTKAVVLPIGTDERLLEGELLPRAKEFATRLNEAMGGLYAAVDVQFHMRPGDRFFYHLQRGVPLRLELGEKDMKAGTVRAVRRDNGEKLDIAQDALVPAVTKILDDIQTSLYAKAKTFREKNTSFASSYEELKAALEEKGGFVEAYFAGTPEDERRIKDETGGATPRCVPLADTSTGKCVLTGREGRKTIFAKAY
jgi:prolyl-tRNA synthetase